MSNGKENFKPKVVHLGLDGLEKISSDSTSVDTTGVAKASPIFGGYKSIGHSPKSKKDVYKGKKMGKGKPILPPKKKKP